MSCVSSDRVINVWERSLFTWNALVLTVKSSKVCNQAKFNKFLVFWEILVEAKLLLLMTDPSVEIGSNELCLFWKGEKYLRQKFIYLKRSSISCKKFWRVHPKTFLRNFQFFKELK